MSEHDRRAIATIRFDNATRCIKSSKLLLEDGDYKSTANRSYYAIFYVIRYDDFYVLSKEEVIRQTGNAEIFIDSVCRYLLKRSKPE